MRYKRTRTTVASTKLEKNLRQRWERASDIRDWASISADALCLSCIVACLLYGCVRIARARPNDELNLSLRAFCRCLVNNSRSHIHFGLIWLARARFPECLWRAALTHAQQQNKSRSDCRNPHCSCIKIKMQRLFDRLALCFLFLRFARFLIFASPSASNENMYARSAYYLTFNWRGCAALRYDGIGGNAKCRLAIRDVPSFGSLNGTPNFDEWESTAFDDSLSNCCCMQSSLFRVCVVCAEHYKKEVCLPLQSTVCNAAHCEININLNLVLNDKRSAQQCVIHSQRVHNLHVQQNAIRVLCLCVCVFECESKRLRMHFVVSSTLWMK